MIDGRLQATVATPVYEPRADRWSYLPPLPPVLGHGAAALEDGRVMVGGGSPGGCGTFCSLPPNSAVMMLAP